MDMTNSIKMSFEIICSLNRTIDKLKQENLSLKNELLETRSALIAAEIRENDLVCTK